MGYWEEKEKYEKLKQEQNLSGKCDFCGKITKQLKAVCSKGHIKSIQSFCGIPEDYGLCSDCAKKCKKCNKYFCPKCIKKHRC